MKQLIKNYSFDKTAKTVTFTDFASISLDRVYLVTNVTSNTIIYQFNDNTLGGTVSTNVLSLTYNTASMANTDKLQIIYDSATGDPTYDSTPLASGAATAANQTNGNQLARITDGTNQANVLKSDLTTAGKNALLAMPVAYDSGSVSAAALNADIFPATDVSMYKSFSIQITGTFTATYTFQGSNDNFASANSTFSIQVIQANGNNPGIVTSSGTTNILWKGPITFKYLRIRVTSYTSGTVVAQTLLSPYVHDPSYIFANVNGAVTATPPNGVTTGTVTTSSTSITALGNLVLGGYIAVYVWGTYSGVTFTLTSSGDNGSNYFNVPVYDSNAGRWLAPGTAISPGTNASNIYYVPGATNTNQTRLLASAYTSGTMNVRINGSQNGMTGSTMTQDNSTGATGSTVPTSASFMAGQDSSNNLRALRMGDIGDGSGSNTLLANVGYVSNGSTYDRMRSANTASGTNGTGLLGTGALGFDGTNYQRMRVDTNGSVYTRLLDGFGNVLSQVTPSDGGTAPTTALGTNSFLSLYNGSTYDRIRSASGAANTTGTGLLGTGALGFDGTNYQRLKVDTNGNQTLGATTTGGYTPGKLIGAASTNATSIKASAGTVGYITASNINASPRYVKLYDKASAPTVGTDTPVHTFIIPGNVNGTGTNIPLPPQGIACSNGIAIAVTAGIADSDTTAILASEVIINYGYK